MRRRVVPFWVALAAVAVLAAAAHAQSGGEFRGGQWQETAPPAEGTAEGELSLVRVHVDNGQYRKAVKAANTYLGRYSEPAGREEVMLLAGEAEMKRDRLLQGYEWFEKQLAEYPDGRFSDRALDREFAVAEAFLAGKKQVIWGFLRLPARDEGLDILSRVAEHAPGTALAQRALLRIADDRVEHGEWADAVDAYDRYVALYPQGDRASEAMLRAAQAMLQSFTGLGRDETPLVEAEHRYREFQRRFPLSASEADVEGTLEHIRSLRAASLAEEGRFYERVGKPSAAVYTYQLVIARYPGTEAAAQAELALMGLRSQPETMVPVTPAIMEIPAPEVITVSEPAPPVTTRPAKPPSAEPIDIESLPPSSAPAGESP